MALQVSSKSWRFLVITVLILGIFFRFANLDRKPYWWDEVTNSIHSAGYGKQEFFSQVKAWRNQDLAIADLHQYQFPNPETSSWDAVKALATGEPQSPPVYYLLSRWWTQLWGSTITVQRSLSALVSLLAFPSMYWLCRELFESPVAAWVGVMVLAVSPFHLLFAQEVRMYSTWTVTILVATAALLRAIRLKRKRDWGLYSASLAFSFYTFPLSALVAIAHGIYMAIAEFSNFWQSNNRVEESQANSKSKGFKFKISQIFANYLLASNASVIAFAPWLYCITQVNEQKMADWRQATLPFLDLFKYWLLQTALIFADLNPNYRGGSGGGDSSLASFSDPRSFVPTIFVWVILIYGFYFLIRRSPPQSWLLILALVLVPSLALGLPDLLFGGIRSTVTRYLIPCYLGIQLAVVNLIATKASRI